MGTSLHSVPSLYRRSSDSSFSSSFSSLGQPSPGLGSSNLWYGPGPEEATTSSHHLTKTDMSKLPSTVHDDDDDEDEAEEAQEAEEAEEPTPTLDSRETFTSAPAPRTIASYFSLPPACRSSKKNLNAPSFRALPSFVLKGSPTTHVASSPTGTLSTTRSSEREDSSSALTMKQCHHKRRRLPTSESNRVLGGGLFT